MSGIEARFRFALLGANEETAITLRGFVESGFRPDLVICAPREMAAHISDFADIAKIAGHERIPVLATADINSVEVVKAIRAARLEYLYITGWSQLLRPATLAAVQGGVIGSHPSALPAGRGKAALPWTILEHASENAVSLFRVGEGVDDGAILLQRRYAIPDNADVGQLYRINAENLRDAFLEVHCDLDRLLKTAEPQREEAATYRGRRIPADGFLDFAKPADDLILLVRAVSHPYPGAYAYYNDDRIAFFQAERDLLGRRSGVVGQVLARRKDGILVQAGDGGVWLSKLFRMADGDPSGPNAYEAISPSKFPIGATLNYRVHDVLRELRLALRELKKEMGDS